MRRLLVTLALVGLTACAGAEAASGDGAHLDRDAVSTDEAVIADTAQGFDAFGFDLLREVDGEAGDNTVLSPVSAGMALSLLLAGAGGETADEIADVLGVPQTAVADGEIGGLLLVLAEAEGVTLTLANAVWTRPDYPLEEVFVDDVARRMGATLDEVDLGSDEGAEAIDAWAADRTGGLIEDFAEALGLPRGDAVAVLANATYFLGAWTEPFDPERTADAPFTRDDGSVVETPLMRGEEVDVAVDDPGDGFLLARVPYGEDGRFGFEVLLPTDGTPVRDALAGIDADEWRERSERATDQTMPVALPRFEIESELGLNDALQALGVEAAFDPGRADFRPMSPANPWLDTVVQKAVIEVDEEGTEAAAATGGVMVESAPATQVIVDRSFAFAVRDTHTGAALFLGVVGDPTA